MAAIEAMVILFVIAGIILFKRMKQYPIVEEVGEQPVVQSVSKVLNVKKADENNPLFLL